MPLRDHFRSPLDDVRSWESLHAMWPATVVQTLNKVLPEPYYAEPGVHLGTIYEVDIATYRGTQAESNDFGVGEGGVAIATYAPPKPISIVEPKFPRQDEYEVLIFKNRRNRSLVAAIEFVSPSNKDRPESRGAFVAKVTNLVRNFVSVSIVDVVSTSTFNLYKEFLKFIETIDPALGAEPSPIYALTLRARYENYNFKVDSWYYALTLGQSLPKLPICLEENTFITLDLEMTYEETCRSLKIR